MSTGQESPVVVLKEVGGARHLAIWMSAAGAAAILAAMEVPDVDHPSPHDLFVDLALAFSHRIEAVHLVGHQEGVFYAEIIVDGDAIPARPSDAIAVALRSAAPIRCPEGVLAAVGFETHPAAAEPSPEREVEMFREFLDQVNPDDF